MKKKLKNLLNIKFESESVYGDNDKYIKTRIEISDGNVNTNFQGQKKSKENASYSSLSLIMLDPIVKVKKKYYTQTLLEECKYEIKKTKMENLINDDLEKSSSDESDDESDNDSHDETESGNETNNDESNE